MICLTNIPAAMQAHKAADKLQLLYKVAMRDYKAAASRLQYFVY